MFFRKKSDSVGKEYSESLSLKSSKGSSKKLVSFLSTKLFSLNRKNYLLVLSLLSTTVAVTALILTLGVMNGFITSLEKGISVMTPDIFLTRFGSGIGGDVAYIENKLKELPGITSFSPYIEGQCIVGFHGRYEGVQIRGVDPSRYIKLKKVKLIAGAMDLREGSFVLGDDLAYSLGVAPGDEVYVFSLSVGGLPRVSKLRVSGIYDSGFWVYDKLWIFTDLNTAQSILGASEYTGIAIFVDADGVSKATKRVASALKRIFPPEVFRITTWFQLNTSLFAALKMEKLAMFLVAAMVVLVSSFSVSSLVYVASLSKMRDVAILRTFGLSPGEIRDIFFRFGLKVGFFGYIIGVALALLLAFLANEFAIIKVPSSVYFVDHIPIVFKLSDFVWSFILMFVLNAVSSIYPAYRASRVDPVGVLREV